MKKATLFLFVLFILSGNYLFAQTVYVTKTGTKYHTEDCGYLSSKIAKDLSDAKKQGYEPCSRCHPPTQVKTSSQQKTSDSSYGSSKSNSATKTRVGAICEDGSKSSATGSGACSHHGGVDYWIYE